MLGNNALATSPIAASSEDGGFVSGVSGNAQLGSVTLYYDTRFDFNGSVEGVTALGNVTVTSTVNYIPDEIVANGQIEDVRATTVFTADTEGVSATGQVEVVAQVINSTVITTGVNGFSEVENVEVSAEYSDAVTGVSAAAFADQLVDVGQTATLLPEGLEGAGEVNAVVVEEGYGVQPTGVEALVELGDYAINNRFEPNTSLTVARGLVGQVDVGVFSTAVVTGVSTAEGIGDLTFLTNQNFDVVGVEADGLVRDVIPRGGYVVEVTGVEAATTTDQVQINLTPRPDGVDATGEVGDVNAEINSVAEVDGVVSEGQVEPVQFETLVSFAVVGFNADALLGDESAFSTYVFEAPSLEGRARVRSVSPASNNSITVQGVGAVGGTNSPIIWLDIIPNGNTIWTDIVV